MKKRTRRKAKPDPAPAPTFWLELDEQDVKDLLSMTVTKHIYDSCLIFQAWCVSPAAGIAQQRKEKDEEKILTRRDTRDSLEVSSPPRPPAR